MAFKEEKGEFQTRKEVYEQTRKEVPETRSTRRNSKKEGSAKLTERVLPVPKYYLKKILDFVYQGKTVLSSRKRTMFFNPDNNF